MNSLIHLTVNFISLVWRLKFLIDNQAKSSNLELSDVSEDGLKK